MKKIRHFMPLIFIVLSATSIHAMLLRAFRRAPANPKQTVRKSPQSGAFYSTAKPATTASSNQTALKSPTANLSWKDKLLNLYKTYAPTFLQQKATSLPIQSVSVTPLQKPKNVHRLPVAEMKVSVKTSPQIASDEIIAKLSEKNPVEKVSEQESFLFFKLLNCQSLQEMKNVLKYQEEVEYNKQKELLNISSLKWQEFINKTREATIWIKNNCFKEKNYHIEYNSNIPGVIYNRIIVMLNEMNINVESIRLLQQKIFTPDVFGHNTIVANGPLLKNFESQKNNIELKEVPTIIMDSDKAAQLKLEEFDLELYHSIGHLVEGHSAKLKLLEEIVGVEQYNKYLQSSEGKSFLNLLEAQADFDVCLDNAAIAQIGFRTFLHKSLSYFMEKVNPIKSSMSNQDILLTIKSRIENPKYAHIETVICEKPSEEFVAFIQEVNSLDDVEKFCQNKRKTIIASLGLNNQQEQEYLKLQQDSINDWNVLSKKKSKGKHTEEMPLQIMKLIKTLLIQSGIEPSSLHIEINTKVGAGGAVKWGLFESRPTLSISPFMPIMSAIRIVLHEIGHLIKNHPREFALLHNYCLDQGVAKNKIDQALFEFRKLAELEADIVLATRFHDVAKLKYIASKKETMLADLPLMGRGQKASSLHPSFIDRVKIFNKIVRLHAQEKNKPQKAFFDNFSDISKE